LGQMAAGVHPLNRPVPPAGGHIELNRADGRAALLTGLAASHDPRAAQWRRQVPLLKVAAIEATQRQYAVRHQVANQEQVTWKDMQTHSEWSFSHDTMLFRGRDMYTNEHRGWLGAHGLGDTTPFAAVPVLAARGLMTPQQFYGFDSATQKLRQLIGLQAPETLAGAAREADGRLYVLTNQRLIAYAGAAGDDAADGLRTQLFSVALPAPFSDLDRIDIATLLDGTLLSFNGGRQMVDGGRQMVDGVVDHALGAAQTVLFVDPSGHAGVVARRALAHDFPPLYEQRAWWLSPLLHAAVALPDLLLDQGVVPDQGRAADPLAMQWPRPWQALAAALLCAWLSAGAAWLWLRPVRIGTRRKAAWIAAALLLGPPTIPCLVLLQARPPRLAGAPMPAPA
ncbi:MAG: hypothetical protein QFF03_01675, partial [Pseudomonadota bacterium]|nr:hypothetical protein [Pseudomonadota bacterium]